MLLADKLHQGQAFPHFCVHLKPAPSREMAFDICGTSVFVCALVTVFAYAFTAHTLQVYFTDTPSLISKISWCSFKDISG